MPFKSKAQEKWMHANKPEMAKEWASQTPSKIDLPERIHPKISYPKKIKTLKGK